MSVSANSADPFDDGSLIAKLKFDGNVNDVTGNFSASENNISYEDGKITESAVFNGINSLVQLPIGLSNNMKRTVSFFMKSSREQGSSIYQPWSIGSISFSFSHPASAFSGALAVRDSNESWFSTGNLQLDKDVFYHIAVVIDDTELQLYVNGVKAGSKISFSGIYSSSYSVAKNIIGGGLSPISSGGGFVSYFEGNIDHFEMYNRALSGEEVYELYTQSESGPIPLLLLSLSSISWGNSETRAQANPQPDVLQYLKQLQLPTLATKQGSYLSFIDQKGNPRPMGYFESKVLIQDVPAQNRKVMCFTQYGQLLDETRSDALGNYRFDHLLLDTRYLFVAQDNRATPDTPPEYQAVAGGFQSATPYLED